MEAKPDPTPAGERKFISVKLPADQLTDTMIVDKEKGISLLVVAIPMSTPKLTALGLLWCVIDNMTTFYKHAEAAHEARSKPGLIKTGLSEAMSLGKRLMPDVK